MAMEDLFHQETSITIDGENELVPHHDGFRDAVDINSIGRDLIHLNVRPLS